MTKKKRESAACHHFQQQRQRPVQNICPPSHLSLLACTVASLHHKSLVGEILPFQHFCPANSAEGTQAAHTCLLSSTRSHLSNKWQRLHRSSSCPVAGTALRPMFPMVVWRWEVVKSSQPKRWGRKDGTFSVLPVSFWWSVNCSGLSQLRSCSPWENE